MHHGAARACDVISELAAEHEIVVDEASLKAAAIAEEDGLPAVAVVGPEIESQHSQEVGAVFDSFDPGMRNHLVGALFAGCLDDAGAEVDSGARPDRDISVAEPQTRILVEELTGDFDGHPGGRGESRGADEA